MTSESLCPNHVLICFVDVGIRANIITERLELMSDFQPKHVMTCRVDVGLFPKVIMEPPDLMLFFFTKGHHDMLSRCWNYAKEAMGRLRLILKVALDLSTC